MQKSIRKKRTAFRRIIIVYTSFVVILIGIFALLNSNKLSFGTPLVSPLALKNTPNKIVDQSTLEHMLTQQKIKYKKVSAASGASYVVELEDGSEVIFSSSKDSAYQLSSLQLILSRFTIEGKRFSRLDLRFDNPIIVLKK